MANCGLALLDLRAYTTRTAFNNTYYTGTTTHDDNITSLKCLVCKPGFYTTN